jgi:hypothetical protein
MKAFKNAALTALFTMGIFSTALYTSCSKDECKDVVCNNGGTCVDGTCSCPLGYEGSTCQTSSASKFVGTWTASETCSGVTSTPYQVTITADPSSPTKLLVSNLGNYDCSGSNIVFTATLTGANSFTINGNSCATQMNATGTLNGNKVEISYTATYKTDNCTTVLTK